jgi:hypothetical protein
LPLHYLKCFENLEKSGSSVSKILLPHARDPYKDRFYRSIKIFHNITFILFFIFKLEQLACPFIRSLPSFFFTFFVPHFSIKPSINMRLTAATIFFGLVTSSLASPIPDYKHAKRGVLTQQSYDDFQISDGVAGNSVAEVLANFPVRFVLPQNATLSSYPHTNPFRSTPPTSRVSLLPT